MRGVDRKRNLFNVLNLMGNEIDKKISSPDQLFIKVNTIDSNFPLACTHYKAIEAVIEYFRGKFDRIIIGDNSFAFMKGKKEFEKLNYQKIQEKFKDVVFSDLITKKTRKIYFKDINRRRVAAEVSNIPVESSFVVSLAVPKTHDFVIASGCLKNMLGCVIENRKAVHGVGFKGYLSNHYFVKSCKVIHKNLVEVVREAKPDLGILDAFVCMEGNGPIFGRGAKFGVALASLDPVALDATAFKMCGFNLNEIRYLDLARRLGIGKSELKNVEIIGGRIKNLQREIRRHRKYRYQVLFDETKVSKFSVDYMYPIEVIVRLHRLKDTLKERLIPRMH